MRAVERQLRGGHAWQRGNACDLRRAVALPRSFRSVSLQSELHAR